jgi:hypothetical protein
MGHRRDVSLEHDPAEEMKEIYPGEGARGDDVKLKSGLASGSIPDPATIFSVRSISIFFFLGVQRI